MFVHPIIRLKPGQGRRLRGGAPWAFSNEIVMASEAKSLVPGTVVTVVGDDGQKIGVGYFNPNSLIAVRMLDPDPEVVPDADFLAARLSRALALRDRIYENPYFRLVHSEGDLLPGLVIDRFDDTCVVQITTAGMERLLAPLLEGLEKVLSPRNILLRADAPVRALEGLGEYVRVAKGSAGRLSVLENGIVYFADPNGGQKTGWYYDQRDNRAFMASLARGRSVLDVFSYTGGFALAAANGGAKEVMALDSSASAVALAEESATANRLQAKFLKVDAFDELERLSAAGEKFDIVIADPPPFVKSRKDLEAGARAYRKLARLAARIVSDGGFLLLASCSHNISSDRFAQECASGIHRAGRTARQIRRAGAGPDHPVHPMLPETEYLKAAVYALD